MALAAAAAAALALGSPADASHTADSLAGSIVPTGRQEYVVLGNEQHVWRMMERVRLGQNPIATGFGNGMNSVVSAVASADAQVVTYDQWEDGYEADILAPVQASTLVLGDGNPANGRACDWTTDPRVAPCDGTNDDVLFQGTAITLNSNQGLGAGCTAGIRCSVPLTMPLATRSAADVRFDGGDRLVTSGGPLSLIHNQDPITPFIGGSTEVLPRQAFAGATAYYVPAGENDYPGTLNAFRIFHFVAVNIAAFDDDTQVFINSPGTGGGTVSFTLNRGQHYTNCLTWDATTFNCNGGAIDGVAAASVQINTATKISTTKPVVILLLAGGDGNWATDLFPILPDLLHGSDYVLASPGDNPALPAISPNRPLNVFAYNPDSASSVTITATDSVGTNTTTLAANGVFDYRNRFGRNVPTDSTVRLTADRNFWGLAVHDYLGTASDWGYSWLATKFLTNSYTVSFAPGVNNLPTSATPAQRLALGAWAGGTTSPGDPDCTIPPAGPNLCDSINRAPVYVAATLDGTLVKVDFDNDGFFDYIDTNSDDYPENGVANDGTCATPAAPWNVPGLTNCLYSLNALQVLRVYDYTDYDNTGTRIQATKPVAMSYGQDTDQATGPDPVLDTGYTVYPLIQRFLDPVLVVGKTATPNVVSGLTGGQVTFTITLQSYAFAPLTSVAVWDTLPLGLSQADYVPGTTRITYPDLSQDTAEPTFSVVSGRTRMDWTIPPSFTMGVDQTLTVSFTMNVPAGATTLFSNEARGRATYSGRLYNAVGGADVVRTPISLTKLATDDGSPQPGDVITYTLQAANNGSTAETGVRITDAIPAGTTFLAGSVATTGGGFTGTFSAAENAVVWTSASFAGGASATLSFQVRINVGTAPGTVVANRGLYDSAQTPRTFSSSETLTTVVGPLLSETKTIMGGVPSALHPLEPVTFEVQVRNSGAGAATSVRITDALALSNATYAAGTMQYSVNGAPFVALTDAADPDAGTLTGTTVQLLLPSLAPSADVRFRFQARINAGTGGLAMNNQATVSATEVGTADTNLLQVPIVGTATVVGRVFRDLDGDGVLGAGEPGLASVAVLVTDAGSGFPHLVSTDAFGLYTVVVPAGATRLQVQTSTLPPGFTLTTGAGSEDQSPTALAGQTISAPTVASAGYSFPPLTVTKVSSAGGTVVPGQTVTYTVTVTNGSGETLSNVQIHDPLPAGASYVAGSAQLTTSTASPFRITEYPIGAGPFTGTTYDLTLNQDLGPDFFVIVQPEGRSDNTSDGPDVNYASVVAAGAGVGDLAAAAAPNQIRLQRRSNADSWAGVVTVVECLQSCTSAGFRLLGAERVSHTGAGTTGTDTTTAWTDIGRVMLVGGANGAGCDTNDTSDTEHKNCHVRLWPSGANTINWTRDAGGATLTAATSTVMVVQWGSEWTVQRTAITNGNGGGADINAASEYNTAAIVPVLRSGTWVWGIGHTNSAGVGSSAEGVALTLGDGTNPSPLPSLESRVAAGIWYPNSAVRFDVYALSHPSLSVDHRFTGTTTGNPLTLSVTVNPASSPRLALGYDALGSNDTASHPASMLAARYTAAQPSTSVTLERRRNIGNFAAWVQGIDFTRIHGQTSALCNGVNCFDPQTNPNVLPAAAYALPAGTSLTYTYQVAVDLQPSPAIASIDNTAVASATGAGPVTATATASDTLVRPRVVVEPNNAGYANAGTTITFTHDVTNAGSLADACSLTVTGERGWRVDLVDPDTGVVIATDLTSDGTWDSGALPPSTGTLAPGASKEFKVRVWVPSGATAGIEDTVRLRAISGLTSTAWDDAKDEITVLSSTLGSVIVTPDNSGVVQAGSYTAYAHRVINNTAIADTFDLRSPLGSPTGVDSSQGWTNTIHWDTNGDGVYTPGTDLQIVNTAQLPPGGSQLIFVVVNAPAGTASGTRDVSHLTAWSRNDPVLFGAATDTSTVVTAPRHDLSGGGTRVVAPGDVAVYPGTIVNLGPTSERFELTITPSNLFGPEGDGLAHPTELWVDTDDDGVPDKELAVDATGDGTWDLPLPLGARFARGLPLALNGDSDGDGLPDVAVAGGGALAYELRRPIDLNQKIQRDYVTLSSRSVDNPTTDPDNVTATWIFAAATRAGILGLRVDAGGIAFATSTQSRTLSFVLYQTDDPTGARGREALHAQPVVSPVPDSITPILYTVPTRPVEKRFVMIEETELDGGTVWTGPFAVGEARLERSLGKLERRLDAAGVPEGAARWLKGYRRTAVAPARAGVAADLPAAEPLGDGRTRAGVKIEVAGGGPVRIPAADLEAFGLPEVGPRVPLRLTNLGRPVAFSWERRPDGSLAVSFEAQPLRTDYSDRNVYLLTPGSSWRQLPVPLTRSAEPETPGFQRVERDQLYIPSLPAGVDPWQWDFLLSGAPWPDPGYDPEAGDFDLPYLGRVASGPVPVRLRLVGYTNHRHSATASINGVPVGSVTFDGPGPALLTGTVAAQSLRLRGNRLSIAYSGSALPDSPPSEAFAYLDYVDVAVPRSIAGRSAPFTLAPWRPLLPALGGVDYLVVTHPLFRTQADRIAAEKAKAGHVAAVVETTTAYDRFSAGVVEPRAIQALVRHAARASGVLRYVLLVGDDSFDPLDLSGRGVPSFVPSLFARDSGWGLVPSENQYADLDDDGRPDLAIGRLPVRTPAQAEAVADKIAAQDAALLALGDAHLAVADNSTETDAPFRDDAQDAIARLPEGSSVRWADLAQGPAAARAALLAGWRAGVAGTHYFGHGGLTEWADEQVLTTDDVAALGSGWRPTVLFTWACLSQYYLGVDGPSLNESLVLQPGGGALASFGPAGITPPARQAPLIARVYDELRTPGIGLGEAIRRAKAAALADQPGSREVIEGFHLFGDPALVLHLSAPPPQ